MSHRERERKNLNGDSAKNFDRIDQANLEWFMQIDPSLTKHVLLINFMSGRGVIPVTASVNIEQDDWSSQNAAICDS